MLTELNDRINKFLEKRKLPVDFSINIDEPKLLNKYSGTIPGNVYNRINKVVDLFKDKKMEFYVADVTRDPDPILFVQVDGKKEYTFVVGYWL